MALDSNVAFINTDGSAFPDNKSVNASGPSATDGTEFVKLMIDNYMFGPQQALINHAGLIPDGISEADGASQELEALQKSFGYPGEAVDWYGDLDPAVIGMRVLLLEGQGILIANFQELATAVYVGDGNNATAPAFYKADDAAGTIRNIAGIYLILPDATDVYPTFVGETIKSGRIENNGAASILSENTTWLTGVSRVALGRVTIDYTVLGLTVPPSVVATNDDLSAMTGVRFITATTADIYIYSDGGTPLDRDFSIFLQPQEDDYTVFSSDFIRGAIRY